MVVKHSEMVIIAEKWLKNTLRCGVTFREFVANTSTGEIPDVIGWVGNKCIVVEVKTNRADFLGDKRKRHRHPQYSDKVLGHWRFYVTPPGIVKPDEIPERWGLYEYRNRFRHIVGEKYANAENPPFPSNRSDEVIIMYSALRRLVLRGCIDRVYERL